MSITPIQYASAATTASVTSLSVTLRPTTANNLLVAIVAVGSTASNGTCPTPSGWSLSVGPVSTNSGAVADVNLYIFHKLDTAGGTTSVSFTDTVASGITVEVWEFYSSTGWASSLLDVTASSANQAATTAPVTGATTLTAQAEELWIGALSTHVGSTVTYSAPLNGFTLQGSVSATGGFFNPQTATLYQIVSAENAVSTGATSSVSTVFAGAIATFMTASPNGAPIVSYPAPSQAATPLSLYSTNVASTTLTHAITLVPRLGSAGTTSNGTTVGTSTGWGELYTQGTTSAWPAATSPGLPSGHGFLWDVTTLEGQQVIPGNWSQSIRMMDPDGSGFICDILARWWVYHSSTGKYSAIGSTMLLQQSVNSTWTTHSLPAAALGTAFFGPGDKLYVDFWLHITANSTASGTSQVSLGDLATTPSGNGAGGNQLTTPGYTSSAIGSSTSSLYVYKQQIVLCYSASGTFIDVIRDAPLLSGVKFAINSAATPLRITLPRDFDSFDEAGTTGARGTIAQGNIWQYWLFGPGLPATGLLKFQGVIDSYQPQISESGEETLTVTITPYDSAVGDSGIVGTVTFGTFGVSATYQDPVTMFNWWYTNNNGVTGHPYTYPLTLDGTNPASSTAPKTTYPFQNQNLGSIFETIRKMLPANWFWRPNQNKTVTLNVPPTSAQHTFVIGQHLSAPQYRKDWSKLRNIIQVQGNIAPVLRLTSALASSTNYTSISVEPLPFALISGQNVELNPTGNNAILLTLSANAAAGATSLSVVSFNTGSNSYAVNTQVGIVIQATATGSDIGTYGYRLLQVADSRVLDVNTAQALANGLLTQYDVEVLRTTIRVIDYRGDMQTGLGYDIESIEPGDSVEIINPNLSSNATMWDVAVWDSSTWDYAPGAALSQVATIYAINYHWDYADLEVGAPPPSQDRTLLELARSFQDYTLVP